MVDFSPSQELSKAISNKSDFPKLHRVKEMEEREFELIMSLTNVDADKRKHLDVLVETLYKWSTSPPTSSSAATETMEVDKVDNDEPQPGGRYLHSPLTDGAKYNNLK
jgi:hypothetical protein